MKIKVLLVDPHGLFRKGLRALLSPDSNLEMVGEASDGHQAIILQDKQQPDVALVEFDCVNGIQAVMQLVKTQTRVIILSAHDSDVYIYRMTEAGVIGYLLKNDSLDDVSRAIYNAANGNASFNPSVGKRLLDRYRSVFTDQESSASVTRVPPSHKSLSSRELQLVKAIAEGYANKQIAAQLGISVKTTEKHRQAAMKKLGIHDIASLTRYAAANGIIRVNLQEAV